MLDPTLEPKIYEQQFVQINCEYGHKIHDIENKTIKMMHCVERNVDTERELCVYSI
jgi:hypothetical protein